MSSIIKVINLDGNFMSSQVHLYDFKMQYYFQALMLSLMEEDRNSIQLIWDHY